MSLADRLGLAALIVTLFGIATVYLWTAKKWIGSLSLVAAVVVLCVWVTLEIRSWRTPTATAAPTPAASARPPQPVTDLWVTADPLEEEAITTSAAILDFLAGRQAKAPPLPKKETWEHDVSIYGVYEQDTLRVYREIYEPRVKQIRDEFAKKGRTNAQLDTIYETPQSSEFIRLVAKSLRELARQRAITEPPVSGLCSPQPTNSQGSASPPSGVAIPV
jgi:hypothetical protein